MDGLVNYVTNSLTTSLNRKIIRVTITLVGDTFSNGKNTIVLERLRTRVDLVFGNGSIMPSAYVKIYGFNIKAMEKLIRIRWVDIQSMQNQIKVEVANEGESFLTVYQGNVTFANIDSSAIPDMALSIESITGVYNAYLPATPLSFKGSRPVADVMEEIATGMGYRFSNNDVPTGLMIKDATLNDTGINKLRKLAKDYQIDLYITFSEIVISRRGSPRQTQMPVISPKSGLIGYPTPTMQGIQFQCLYNEAVQFGGLVAVRDSIIEPCNGQWRVFGITTTLESEVPGGSWFMDVKATWPEASNVAISR